MQTWRDKVTREARITVQRGRSGGTIHLAGDACGALLKGPRTRGDVLDVLGGLTQRRCKKPYCRGVLTDDDVALLRRLCTILDGLHRDVADVDPRWTAMHVAGARNIEEAVQTYRNDGTQPRYRRLVHELHRIMLEQVQVVHSACQDPTWKSRLHDAMNEQGAGGHNAKVLRAHRLGTTSDMGLMVGGLGLRSNTTVNGILYLLAKDGQTHYVVATMGTLVELVENEYYMPIQDGLIGANRQLVPLPRDATPELLETIAGIYQSGGDAMGDLRNAVHAARALLQE